MHMCPIILLRDWKNFVTRTEGVRDMEECKRPQLKAFYRNKNRVIF